MIITLQSQNRILKLLIVPTVLFILFYLLTYDTQREVYEYI
jgi:hypothetical protein